MDDFIVLILLVVLCVLTGPAALIISLIALNRTREKSHETQKGIKAVSKLYETVQEPVIEPPKIKQQLPPPVPPIPQKAVDSYIEQEKKKDDRETAALEQKIGTRWILIAGVITVFAGVCFFLKYAYDNFSIGPLGKITAVTVFGFIALLAGEITRRRDYGIVAKGVTALGFAILYAAVFAAYQIYGLIGYIPACIFAIVITVAAMIYAVVLDEILIAFLSLLGGFSTPVIVLSKITTPTPLFVYILILGAGAMLCAYYRRWKAINFLSFIGTFTLYTIWFNGSKYNSILCEGKALDLNQISFVLGWLGVFFMIYLVMPILYGLVKKVKSNKEDVLLILANAAAVLYYLCVVLFDSYRGCLAFEAVILALIHFAFSVIVNRRCKEDVNLRLVLQAIGIFFITLAVPFYYRLDATTIAWACESLVLVLIGLRYASYLTQAGGIIVMFLSIGCLIINIPMHSYKFNFILNPEFGTWCFVSVAIYLCHLLYRKNTLQLQNYAFLSQILYGLSVLLLFAAGSMEWYYHCRYNLLIGTGIHCIAQGQLIIFSMVVLMFLPRFICPGGILSEVLSWVLLVSGAIFTIIALGHLHSSSFIIFANPDFAAVFTFLLVILICQIKYRQVSDAGRISQIIYGLLGLLLLSTVAAEWYWHCKYNIVTEENILLKGLVIIFTVIMLLFVIRPISPGGIISAVLAAALAGIGAIFTMVNFPAFHNSSFVIFVNTNLAVALSFIVGLFLAAWLFGRTKDEEYNGKSFTAVFALGAIFMLWIILTQEIYLYWYCKNCFAGPVYNWKFLAQMYISIMWALYGAVLMVIGFWRKIRTLRYISIGLFAILLVKVFLIDTQEIKNIYRVAAFMVTGVTLVGISYLYQYLKKKGFFDALFVDKKLSD